MGGKFHPKLNTCGRPIANKYREGKMKRTLKRESKVLEIAGIEGMASSIGRGIFGQASWLGRVAIGFVVFAARFVPGREPVLFPGLGQDGFAVVENGFGKVAVSSRGQSL